MTSLEDRLRNLSRTGNVQAEVPNKSEIDGLIDSALRKLPDAEREQNSSDTRFMCAYDAAHSLALAALRWHGYRPKNRSVVFQLLGATVSFPDEKWRFLDNCHGKRNAALYDGDFQASEAMIKELIGITKDLLQALKALDQSAG